MFQPVASCRFGSFTPLLASGAAFFLSASLALAADLDPGYADVPAPIPQQNVTFGSGWYIRGDIGATRLPSISINQPTNLPTPRDPSLVPSIPTESVRSGSAVGYTASLGGGYQLNNWFRADVTADFQQPLATAAYSRRFFCATGVSYNSLTSTGATDYSRPSYANGGCSGTFKASLNSYDVLANGYIDLGNWYSVTPYVGAGVGLSFGHYQTSSTYIQANGVPYQVTYNDPKFNASYYQNYDRSSSSNYYNLAWALMGGVAVDVYQHTKLDIGYRYLNLGQIAGVSGKLTSQEIHAGLRYMIDN